jgi:hypothetical protein
MKKNKFYYSENTQENEDVYTLHPANAIIYENVKDNHGFNNHTDTVNSGSSSIKMQFRRLVQSRSMILSRIIETQAGRPPLLPGQIYTDK